jgi:hypothetical protein
LLAGGGGHPATMRPAVPHRQAATDCGAMGRLATV